MPRSAASSQLDHKLCRKKAAGMCTIDHGQPHPSTTVSIITSAEQQSISSAHEPWTYGREIWCGGCASVRALSAQHHGVCVCIMVTALVRIHHGHPCSCEYQSIYRAVQCRHKRKKRGHRRPMQRGSYLTPWSPRAFLTNRSAVHAQQQEIRQGQC